MPLNKAEEKLRRVLAKDVAAELRALIKPAGWRMAQGWLLREDDGWFVDVRPSVWIAERKSTIELRMKPMSFDRFFWDVVDAADNGKLPLSFRLRGAWTVSTPALSEIEIDEASMDAAELAALMLQIASRQLEQSRHGRGQADFLSFLQAAGRRGPARAYLPAEFCALVLSGDRRQARLACLEAREAGCSGGFSVGNDTFVDLAIRWLDVVASTRH